MIPLLCPGCGRAIVMTIPGTLTIPGASIPGGERGARSSGRGAMTKAARCPSTGAVVIADGGRWRHVPDGSPCFWTQGRILQVVGVEGWRAVVAREDEEGGADVREIPVVLGVREFCHGGTEVVGLAFLGGRGAEPVTEDPDFLRVLGPGQDVDDEDRRQAAEHVRRRRVREEAGSPSGAARATEGRRAE